VIQVDCYAVWPGNGWGLFCNGPGTHTGPHLWCMICLNTWHVDVYQPTSVNVKVATAPSDARCLRSCILFYAAANTSLATVPTLFRCDCRRLNYSSLTRQFYDSGVKAYFNNSPSLRLSSRMTAASKCVENSDVKCFKYTPDSAAVGNYGTSSRLYSLWGKWHSVRNYDHWSKCMHTWNAVKEKYIITTTVLSACYSVRRYVLSQQVARDALWPSVVSFNGVIHRAQYFIIVT